MNNPKITSIGHTHDIYSVNEFLAKYTDGIFVGVTQNGNQFTYHVGWTGSPDKVIKGEFEINWGNPNKPPTPEAVSAREGKNKHAWEPQDS